MDKTSTTPSLELRKIQRHFQQGEKTLNVLNGVDLKIKNGEIVALIGQSGAGKSTLLQIAGLLEQPDDGEVLFEGQNCATMSDLERTQLRRKNVGFVFQFHHLLPEFTAIENVSLPQQIAYVNKTQADERATKLLTSLGLAERMSHQPMQLSGGEQQRVAIARALANRPKILLADEPTGNLDPETSARVFKNFLDLVREEKLSALIATHNFALARHMDRIVRLKAGKLENVLKVDLPLDQNGKTPQTDTSVKVGLDPEHLEAET